MTKEEMLEDLIVSYISKIRMGALALVRDLDDFQTQVERRFKKCLKTKKS